MFLKLCSAKSCKGFRQTKMRNDGKVLVVVQSLYVRVQMKDQFELWCFEVLFLKKKFF